MKVNELRNKPLWSKNNPVSEGFTTEENKFPSLAYYSIDRADGIDINNLISTATVLLNGLSTILADPSTSTFAFKGTSEWDARSESFSITTPFTKEDVQNIKDALALLASRPFPESSKAKFATVAARANGMVDKLVALGDNLAQAQTQIEQAGALAVGIITTSDMFNPNYVGKIAFEEKYQSTTV